MPDITGLSSALNVSLVSVTEHHGKQPVALWLSVNGRRMARER